MRISVFPKGELDAIIKRDLTVFDWIEMSKALPAEGLELHSAMFWETTDIFVDTLAAAITDSGRTLENIMSGHVKCGPFRRRSL